MTLHGPSIVPGGSPDAQHPVGVLLHGGPCHGVLRYVSVRVAEHARLTCQGAVYVPDPGDTNWPPRKPYTTERWITSWQAQAVLAGKPPAPARHVGGAWSRLMRVFTYTGKQQIMRQRRATRRMDRLAYKLRRRR